MGKSENCDSTRKVFFLSLINLRGSTLHVVYYAVPANFDKRIQPSGHARGVTAATVDTTRRQRFTLVRILNMALHSTQLTLTRGFTQEAIMPGYRNSPSQLDEGFRVFSTQTPCD